MRIPEPLPYVVRTSQAAAQGIPRSVLHGAEFTRVRRGVWTPAGVDVTDPDVRIAAVASQLPASAVVGGWAAARLHEKVWRRDELEVFDGSGRWDVEPRDRRDPTDPRERRAAPGPARILVCIGRHGRLTHRSDVRILRSPPGDGETSVVGGLRITSPVRTAFDLARLLPLQAAVVGVDRLLHVGVVAHHDLHEMLARRAGGRGLPTARRAISLADAGAESPQESVLRLLWLESGMPPPIANAVVRGLDGRVMARVDLLDPEAGVVGEYDGAVHSHAARRSEDARRHEALESLGLVVVRATATDVGHPSARRAWQHRLRAAYRRAAERPESHTRWRVSAP